MKEELGLEEKRELLRVARGAILERFGNPAYLCSTAENPLLNSRSGAFVSIHNANGGLRGCIGTFISNHPLLQTVKEMALQAAFHDPRFRPLSEKELEDIHIEISVLSPMEEIKDIKEIQIGRHGLYIIKGRRSGTLLPQVAVHEGWNAVTFLEHTCLKAGLPANGWKEEATIFVYSAKVFSEEEMP